MAFSASACLEIGRCCGTVRPMPVVFSISSQVVRGHVGNAAVAPALLALGHEVWPLPTVILSNHPGHGGASGFAVAADDMQAIIDRLDEFGWLGACDAVLSGYFRAPEQVRVVADLVRRLKARNPDLTYCCDPVLGDEATGLYVAQEIAEAVRDELIPLADIAVPNRWELEWLRREKISAPNDAVRVARALGPAEVVVTSVPDGAGRIATLWWTRAAAFKCTVEELRHAPHGIGDLLSALVLGLKLSQDAPVRALGRAGAMATRVLEASRGRDELDLVAGLNGLADVGPAGTVLVGDDDSHWVAGVDGCPGGWFVVLANALDRTEIRCELCRSFADVLALAERPSVIAVDIPIGLPEVAIKGGRSCDVETRSRLGGRQSSVFSVPSRAALMETDYRRACEVNQQHSEPSKMVSKQCFALFPRMREVDALMTRELQSRVFEVHPELAFWALNGSREVPLPKKVKNDPSRPGIALRRKLLRAAGISVDSLDLSGFARRDVGADDVVDASALAWSALRLLHGEALTLPADPPRDERGLRMEINA